MLASTHGLPLSFLLERWGAAAPRIVLVGVQPARLRLGDGLSAAARDAVDALATDLRERGPEAIPRLGEADDAARNETRSSPPA